MITRQETSDVVEYYPDGYDDPDFVRSQAIVSSVRVRPVFGHELVGVWNRGGKAGELYVNLGDGEAIARRLLQ